MRVLIIGEVFYPEDFIINDLALNWQNNGFVVNVLTRVPSYPQDRIYPGYRNKLFQKNDYNGIKIYRFPVVLGYQRSKIIKIINYINFVFWGSIISLFIGHKYDHIFVYQTGPLTLAIPAVLLKKIFKKKVTIWVQDLWPDTVYAYGFKRTKYLEKFLQIIVSFVYKNTTNILISCPGFERRIREYNRYSRIEWIPNWSLVNFSNSLSTIELNKGFNFTFAGNVGKVQNLENVILGFAKISEKYENAFLNIVGDGSNLNNLKDLVSNNKIKNVIFHGRKPVTDMPALFTASDVLIISLTSADIFKLTIPSKLQSYLKSSKPLMGVIVGETKSIIEKYELGRTAYPENIEEIANTFESFLLMDAQSLREMGANANKINDEIFNRDILIKKISDIIFS